MSSHDDSAIIDRLCDEFEEQLRSGDRPLVSEYLDQVSPGSRGELLRELLAVEMELVPSDQWGQRLEEYRKGLPEYRAILDELVDADAVTEVVDSSQVDHDKSRQIGPYKILQVIGEGGMGSVYMAQQDQPVRRRVALKVIKAGLNSKQVIARFEAERQALAMMDHPSIARILDAGTTEDGQPFFAMELVKGIELNEYCDRHRLSIPQRLDLFCQICEGVHHAHQKGIIHRDLKPSNILVADYNGQAVPKIIDFGLAKALEVTNKLTDKTMFTEFGQVLGTLKYMSPEQAGLDSLDIDIRSDIYTLGVILYELLTGATPLDEASMRGQALLKILELVREQDAPRPSTKLTSRQGTISTVTEQRRIEPRKLSQILSGDMDWIVMKAIDKDRTRRYESASAFSDDVQRFLDNEVIEARPPSAGYKLKKFARKNRGLVTGAALLVAALLVGLAGTTWQMKRAWDAEAKAEKRLQETDEAKKLAESNAQLARQQSQLALSTLTSVINEIQAGLRNLTGSGEIRQQLLKTSLEKLSEVSTEFTSQATVDAQSVISLQQIGDVVLLFGDNTSDDGENRESRTMLAKRFFERALSLANELSAANPDVIEHQLNLSNSHLRMGDVCFQMGQTEEALEHFQQKFKIDQKLSQANPDDSEITIGLRTAYGKIGDVYLRMYRSEEALEQYQQMLLVHQRLEGSQPDADLGGRSLMVANNKMGDIYIRLGRHQEALEKYQEGGAIAQRLLDDSPTSYVARRDLLVSNEKMGDACELLNETDGAIRHGQEAVRIATLMVESEPNNDDAKRLLAVSHSKLGRALIRVNRNSEAAEQYTQAVEINRASVKADPGNRLAKLDLAISLGNLGEFQLNHDQTDKAEQLLVESADVYQSLVDTDPANSANQRRLSIAYGRLGHLHSVRGEYQRSIQQYEKTLGIIKDLIAADPKNDQAKNDMAMAYENLGISHLKSGQENPAIANFRETIKIHRRRLEADPDSVNVKRELMICVPMLGDAFMHFGRAQEAVPVYVEFVERAKEMAERFPTNAKARRDHALAHLKLGMAEQASENLNQAIQHFAAGGELFESMINEDIDAAFATAALAQLRTTEKSARELQIALGDWTQLLESEPENLPRLLNMRATRFASDSNFEEAAKAAARVGESAIADQQELYDAACILARCASSIKPAGGETLSEQELRQQEKWIDAAVATLKKSVNAGWDDFEQMKREPGLGILQDLPEFQSLLSPADEKSDK